uniref:NADH-ubiquinone oxidoreductase chain 4L n=1 Tax=Diplectrona hexapetala (nom. nud.) TaxID=2904920 RepID=A0A9E8LNS4_9NEOP|nr:NADH dehydrogenase subunit 4L [Diplectrona hexapetala (nom. nud.)]UZZ43866.1 NADH dehydrogenase subunit 4L [Diplectrona hexapetala (nom. nud.)]
MVMTMLILMMVFFMGNIMFVSNRKHMLNMLLSLEFMMLALMILLVMGIMAMSNQMFMLMIFLVFVVCEGVLGLSVLVVMIRAYGMDYFQVFSSLKC